MLDDLILDQPIENSPEQSKDNDDKHHDDYCIY